MIIHRKTRSDIIIEDLSSLEDLIKSRVIKNFKRTTKDNSKLVEKIFNKDYSSFAEFVGFVREVFNTRFSSDLKKYGYTPKEELEEKKIRSARAANSLQVFAEKHNFSVEYAKRVRSSLCKEFWMHTGLSEEEAEEKIKILQSKNSKKVSTETKKLSSKRTVIYWTSRGYTEEEARKKVSEVQSASSKRRVEYWISRGYSLEDARLEVSKVQSNSAKKFYDNLTDSDRLAHIQKMNVVSFKTLWNEKATRPGKFYIIDLGYAVKIGITIRELKDRYYNVDLTKYDVKVIEFDELNTAFKLEQILIRKFKNCVKRIKKQDSPFGWSETLHGISKNTVIDSVNELLNNTESMNAAFENIKRKKHATN